MTTFSRVLFGLATALSLLIPCGRAQVVSDPGPALTLSLFEDLKAESPLQYKLIHKRYDDALAVMRKVEDIDALSQITGRTALGAACADESADAIDMVKPMVLTYRADVTLGDGMGFTPLHYAARAGNLAVVQFLIDNGADVHAENILGKTPLYSALERKRVRVAGLLRQYGALEVDEDDIAELHASIALQEATAAARRRTKRGASGADAQAAFRSGITSSFDVAADALLADGRVAAAQLLQSRRERLTELVDNTPLEDGMSSMEWAMLIARKSGVTLGIAQSGAASNAGKKSTR